jgi:hypothetical protein
MRIFYRPPPRIHRERKTEDGTRRKAGKEEDGWCVLLSVVHSPLPPISSPLSCAPFHLPAAIVIRARGTGRSPPPRTHYFEQFEAAEADL